MASGDTKTQQYLDVAANGTRADLPTDTCCETRTQTLIRGVAERIIDVEDELERLENNPDVADIVATYADLQAYPTSQLTDKDVVRVLQDETHDGNSTYYRWSTTTQTWTYIGESKQYTDFVGTDGLTGGQNGLVPAPVATDAGKFLNADGSWEEVQAGPTVVQTTGTSTTDVMSQNATTSMVYADPGVRRRIKIGQVAASNADYATAIGFNAQAYGNGTISLGHNSVASAYGSIAIGDGATNYTVQGAISLGAYSGGNITASGMIDVGTSQTNVGYNSSNYRLLTGLYDGQSDHDAVTVGQLNTAIAGVGGVIELTSADYNYDPQNTGSNTAFAMWLLEPGWYEVAESGHTVYSHTGATFSSPILFVVGEKESSASNAKRVVLAYTNSTWYGGTINVEGSSSGFSRLSTAVVQTTGTSTAYVMSQKAVTDALAAAGAAEINSTDWNTLWQ